MSLLLTILLVLCVYLALRLRAKRRIIRSLLDAVEHGRPVLLEQRHGALTGKLMERLIENVNKLIADNKAISHTGRGYFDQIQTTLGNLREAVVMVDAENLIRLSNPVFSELVQPTEDPLGKRLDLYIQGEAFHEFMRRMRERGEGIRRELQVEINARPIWLDVSAASLPENNETEGQHTLFVFHDITRQKNLETMRTEFVANVSHELKTPVTVIKGFAETLVEDEDILSREEKVRFLKKIHSNAERLHRLLQDLLLLSRLESTELILQKECIQLRPFIEDIASSWDLALEESGKQLILDFSPEAESVNADPLRLTQVLTNLLENVLRHARGSKRVEIQTARKGDFVQITVADDGTGIPEADLPHVFQRFYRVEKGRSRESGGTGLGLSIVKHIIAQHGGDVRVRSRKGEGTAIEVLLPMPDAQR